MLPLAQFNDVWVRCSAFSALHAYLQSNTTVVVNTDELLRAEWVARVSALDAYCHEVVAQNMIAIFEGARLATDAYRRFRLPNETVERIRTAPSPLDASAAFDLEVRGQLSLLTFQHPDKIAEGVRLISNIELWNAVAVHLGASASSKVDEAKRLRKELSLVVDRRNRIAHEGDLQPGLPKVARPIAANDLTTVRDLIEKIIKAMDSVI